MKNKTSNLIYTLILACGIFISSTKLVLAQENGIYEVSNNGLNGNQSLTGRDQFYDLAFNLRPTHYIRNNMLNASYDSALPVKMVIEDSKSISWLNNADSKKDSLKLIIINLENSNDLNNPLDISMDKDLMNLNYVYIKCSFNCSENDIVKFIKTDSKVRIFYTNQIGG